MGLCQLERARGRGCFQHVKAKLIEHIHRDHRDEKLVLNQQSAASFCRHNGTPSKPPYRRRKPLQSVQTKEKVPRSQEPKLVLDIVLATRLRPPPLWPDLEASSAPLMAPLFLC